MIMTWRDEMDESLDSLMVLTFRAELSTWVVINHQRLMQNMDSC